MAAKPTLFAEMADLLKAEADADAKAIASKVQGEFTTDAVNVKRPEYLAMIQQRWPDPQFRMDLLQRLGPVKFWHDSHEAWGLPVPKVIEHQPAGSTSGSSDLSQSTSQTPSQQPDSGY